MRGVDAHQQQLVVLPHRLELGREVAAIGAVGVEEALPEAIERHVVVARHHQRRRRQAVDPAPRLPELIGLGALREVAGEHHHVGVAADEERTA